MSFCGLDFGTSNSALGIVNHDELAMIPLESDDTLIRTAIFINDEEKAFLYGREGVNSYLDGDQGRLMLSIKSVLGTPLMHEKTHVLNEMVPFTSIIGLFISEVKKRAEQYCGNDITDVVLGAPSGLTTITTSWMRRPRMPCEKLPKNRGSKTLNFN
jgi:hypothetical chaperone protein